MADPTPEELSALAEAQATVKRAEAAIAATEADVDATSLYLGHVGEPAVKDKDF